MKYFLLFLAVVALPGIASAQTDEAIFIPAPMVALINSGLKTHQVLSVQAVQHFRLGTLSSITGRIALRCPDQIVRTTDLVLPGKRAYISEGQSKDVASENLKQVSPDEVMALNIGPYFEFQRLELQFTLQIAIGSCMKGDRRVALSVWRTPSGGRTIFFKEITAAEFQSAQ